MKTHRKDEVLEVAESLGMKAATEEFNGYTSDAELLSCAAGVLRDFAQTLGEPVAVPDGWQLVPIEPTTEQLKACDTIIQGYGAKLVYMRMVDAAPHHPTTEKGCE